MNKQKLVRKAFYQAEQTSSPILRNDVSKIFSPMTALANDLNEVVNIETPCKRLSYGSTASLEDSPYNSNIPICDFDSSFESCKNRDESFEDKENIFVDDNVPLGVHKLNESDHVQISPHGSSINSEKDSPDSGICKGDDSFNNLGLTPLDNSSSSENLDLVEEIDNLGEETSSTNMLSSLNSLFTAPINNSSILSNNNLSNLTESAAHKKRFFQRSKSLFDTTPTSSKIFKKFSTIKSKEGENINQDGKRPNTDECDRNFKRPRIDKTLILGAKRHSVSFDMPRPRLVRSNSDSPASIMKAVNLSTVQKEMGLVGDYSRRMILPLMKGGRHPDLNTIDVSTMEDILCGKFDDSGVNFRIIDCRYPFEYEGGHIKGAENWYHPEMVMDELKKQKTVIENDASVIPTILIFHCEFSAERGPRYLRLLREEDRVMNTYPALCFPELYVLEGGYKAFYESKADYCDPKDYVKMIDPNFSQALRYHRSRSKIWSFDNKTIRGKGAISRFNHAETDTS